MKKKPAKKTAPRKANVDFRHEAFAREYSICRNGSKSYRAVYGNDMTNEVAARAASRLLTNVRVRSLIKKLDAEHAARFAVTKENTLREWGRIGYSDASRLVRTNGCLRPLDEMDPDTRAAVASIEVFEEFSGKGEDRKLTGYTKKLKLWDKNTALTNIAKHLGMFEIDNAQKADAIAQLMLEVNGHVLRPGAG